MIYDEIRALVDSDSANLPAERRPAWIVPTGRTNPNTITHHGYQ